MGEMHVGYGDSTLPRMVLEYVKSMKGASVTSQQIQNHFNTTAPSTLISGARQISRNEDHGGTVSKTKYEGRTASGRRVYSWRWLPHGQQQLFHERPEAPAKTQSAQQALTA